MNTAIVRALSLDLDDTLWPIAPAIARTEARLHAWLARTRCRSFMMRAISIGLDQ